MTYIPAELRREIIERAGNCCEYCRLSQIDYPFVFHIEHIISEKHDGKTSLDNLALSCPPCNAFKGSDIAGADPQDGAATFLFHPRTMLWEDHFQLSDAIIEPLSSEGRVTVFLLQMNSEDRIKERQLLIKADRYPCPIEA